MQKRNSILPIALLFCAHFLQAQITLSTSDMPVSGTVINVSYPDTVDVSTLGLDNAGANQSWDFSNLVGFQGDPSIYLNAADAPQFSLFPNASLASTYEVTDSSDYTYFLSNSTEFSQLGQAGSGSLVNFAQPFKSFKFPFTSSTIIDQITNVTGDSDGIPVSGTAKTNVSVVGSGTVKTALGTFPCLRVKRITELTATVLFFTITQRDTSWEWWTNSFKAPVFRYAQSYISAFGEESWEAYGEILASQTVATNSVRLPSTDLQVSPNPTAGPVNVTFTAPNSGRISLQVVDATGALVYSSAPGSITAGEQQISIDLQDKPAGIYYICLRQAGKPLAIKQVVKN
jgi:hypothetical protein